MCFRYGFYMGFLVWFLYRFLGKVYIWVFRYVFLGKVYYMGF